MADDGKIAELTEVPENTHDTSFGGEVDTSSDDPRPKISPEINEEIPAEAQNSDQLEDGTPSADDELLLGADAMLSYAKDELSKVSSAAVYSDLLIKSPAQDRVRKLDEDLEKLREQADKITEDESFKQEIIDSVRIRGEGAVEILKHNIAKNVEEEQRESTQNNVYTALVNIDQDIKKTLKEEYRLDKQPFPVNEDGSFPMGDIISALALALYEDGNIENIDDLAVLNTEDTIQATTVAVISIYENARIEAENKKSRKLKGIRAKIADKETERNETAEKIDQEKIEFLEGHAPLNEKIKPLQHYYEALNVAIREQSAEDYFADNEDVLAVFNHMDSKLGDDADAIALKRNDDRKRYFITLKNLDEERFDDLVRDGLWAKRGLERLRNQEEPEENPVFTEKHYDVAELIDQDRDAISQTYIPTFDELDKLAKIKERVTAEPQNVVETEDNSQQDSEQDSAPANYISFAQYKQDAEYAIDRLNQSLKSKEQEEYDSYVSRLKGKGTEDATDEEIESLEDHRVNLQSAAKEANAKLAKLRPDNAPMLRRANVLGDAMTYADEADASEHFADKKGIALINMLNEAADNTDSVEQKSEYEDLKKMIIAADAIDAYQAENGSPYSIMENLRDDVEKLRAQAEAHEEETETTNEKIIDTVRDHMDAMMENYLPTEKQLERAKKTTLGNRVKSMLSRAGKARDKVTQERIEPTFSDEEIENDEETAELQEGLDPDLFEEEAEALETAQEPSDSPDDIGLDAEEDDFGGIAEEAEDAEFEEGGADEPAPEHLDQEPVDAEFDEVEDRNHGNETEEESSENKEKPSMLASFAVASTGAVVAVAVMAATLGLEQGVETYAFGAAGGALAGFALFNGLKNDPKRTLFTLGATVGAAVIVKTLCAGFLATNPGIVAMMGVGALAGAIAGATGAIASNFFDKFNKKENVKLSDGVLKSAFRGAAFGAFAGVLGFAFSSDGAENAVANAPDNNLTNGAGDASIGSSQADSVASSAVTPTPEPTPEANLEPAAGENNGQTNAPEPATAPYYSNMSAVEIREIAGEMYTDGDHQGALDALNIALEKAGEGLDESIQGDIANIAMVHGLDTGTAGFDSAEDMLRSSFAEAGQEGHGRNEDYLRMLIEKRDLLSPSAPSMS